MSNPLVNVINIKERMSDLKTAFTETNYADYIRQQVRGAMRLNMNALQGKTWRRLGYTNYDFRSYYYSYGRKEMQDNGKLTAKLKSIADKYASVQFTTVDDAFEAVINYVSRIDQIIYYRDAYKIEPALEQVRNQRHGYDGHKPWELIDVRSLGDEVNVVTSYKATHLDILHNLHISSEIPTQVAYYPSLRHWRENRAVRTTIGKYLTKYKDIISLSESEIKTMAERHLVKINARAGWTVKFMEHNDPEGWMRVYRSDDVRSCMRGMDAVRVYAHDKSVLRLAYLENGIGEIIGRCIVREDDEKGWLRVYPDPHGSTEGRFLLDSLKAMGYTENINLNGVLLEAIEEGSAYVCPYIDCGNGGDQYADLVHIDGKDYLELGSGDWEATRTDGYVGERCSCDECGDSCDEDELIWIDNEEIRVCPSCLDENFVYAYGRRYEEYFRSDECVEVNGSWYLMETASNHNIYQCDYDGEWYHGDELYHFDEGSVHVNDAVRVDHEHDGDNYIHPDYVHTLSDGTTCHDDDADEYQAEIDEAEAEAEAEDNTTNVEMSTHESVQVQGELV